MMRRIMRPILIVSISLAWSVACQKNAPLPAENSLLVGGTACHARTPVTTLRAQVSQTLRSVPKHSPVKPRAQSRASEDLVPRTTDIPQVFSKESTLFGVEIEIPTTADLDQRYAQMMFEVMTHDKLKNCKLGLSSWRWDQGYRFRLYDEKRHPKNITINVANDPAVVEISTTPLTYTQTESWKDVLEELIFATSRELEQKDYAGNSDHERNRWSGHLNISWPGLMTSMGFHEGKTYSYRTHRVHLTPAEIERQNMNLLLNIFVDFQNHPQLTMGLLGGDIRNATPLAFGTKEEQDTLKTIIKTYESGRITALGDLASKLSAAYPKSFPGRFPSPRYSVINLESINYPDFMWGYVRGTRIEMRGFFSPQNVDAVLANYRLINARLAYLYKNFTLQENRVLAYQPPQIDQKFLSEATKENFKVHGLTGNLSPEEVAKVYIDFVNKAGLTPSTESQFIRDSSVKRAVQSLLQCRQNS